MSVINTTNYTTRELLKDAQVNGNTLVLTKKSNGEVSTIEYTPDLSSLATKEEVTQGLALKANQSTTYTKDEVDELIDEAKPSDYDEVKAQVAENASDIADLESTKADKSELFSGSYEDLTDVPSSFPPSTHTHEQYATKTEVETELGNYVTSSEYDEKIEEIEGELDAKLEASDIADLATKEELSEAISSIEAEIPSVEGLASQEWVETQLEGYTSLEALETALETKSDVGHTHSYSSLTDVPSEFNPSAHEHDMEDIEGLQDALDSKLEASDISDLATKTELAEVEAEIPSLSGYATEQYVDNAVDSIVVPTKTSDLTNDSGFITDSALSGYATEQYVDDAIDNIDLSSKADVTYVDRLYKEGEVGSYGKIELIDGSPYFTSPLIPDLGDGVGKYYVYNYPQLSFKCDGVTYTDKLATTDGRNGWKVDMVYHYFIYMEQGEDLAWAPFEDIGIIDFIHNGVKYSTVELAPPTGIIAEALEDKADASDDDLVNASVSSDTLTLTKRDGSTVQFQGGGSSSQDWDDIDNKPYSIVHIDELLDDKLEASDIANLATKSELQAVEDEIPSISGLASESYVDNAVSSKADASSVYTKTAIDTLLYDKADVEDVPTEYIADASFDSETSTLSLEKSSGETIDVVISGGGGGDVTKAYVDAQDNKIYHKVVTPSSGVKTPVKMWYDYDDGYVCTFSDADGNMFHKGNDAVISFEHSSEYEYWEGTNVSYGHEEDNTYELIDTPDGVLIRLYFMENGVIEHQDIYCIDFRDYTIFSSIKVDGVELLTPYVPAVEEKSGYVMDEIHELINDSKTWTFEPYGEYLNLSSARIEDADGNAIFEFLSSDLYNNTTMFFDLEDSDGNRHYIPYIDTSSTSHGIDLGLDEFFYYTYNSSSRYFYLQYYGSGNWNAPSAYQINRWSVKVHSITKSFNNGKVIDAISNYEGFDSKSGDMYFYNVQFRKLYGEWYAYSSGQSGSYSGKLPIHIDFTRSGDTYERSTKVFASEADAKASGLDVYKYSYLFQENGVNKIRINDSWTHELNQYGEILNLTVNRFYNGSAPVVHTHSELESKSEYDSSMYSLLKPINDVIANGYTTYSWKNNIPNCYCTSTSTWKFQYGAVGSTALTVTPYELTTYGGSTFRWYTYQPGTSVSGMWRSGNTLYYKWSYAGTYTAGTFRASDGLYTPSSDSWKIAGVKFSQTGSIWSQMPTSNTVRNYVRQEINDSHNYYTWTEEYLGDNTIGFDSIDNPTKVIAYNGSTVSYESPCLKDLLIYYSNEYYQYRSSTDPQKYWYIDYGGGYEEDRIEGRRCCIEDGALKFYGYDGSLVTSYDIDSSTFKTTLSTPYWAYNVGNNELKLTKANKGEAEALDEKMFKDGQEEVHGILKYDGSFGEPTIKSPLLPELEYGEGKIGWGGASKMSFIYNGTKYTDVKNYFRYGEYPGWECYREQSGWKFIYWDENGNRIIDISLVGVNDLEVTDFTYYYDDKKYITSQEAKEPSGKVTDYIYTPAREGEYGKVENIGGVANITSPMLSRWGGRMSGVNCYNLSFRYNGVTYTDVRNSEWRTDTVVTYWKMVMNSDGEAISFAYYEDNTEVFNIPFTNGVAEGLDIIDFIWGADGNRYSTYSEPREEGGKVLDIIHDKFQGIIGMHVNEQHQLVIEGEGGYSWVLNPQSTI